MVRTMDAARYEAISIIHDGNAWLAWVICHAPNNSTVAISTKTEDQKQRRHRMDQVWKDADKNILFQVPSHCPQKELDDLFTKETLKTPINVHSKRRKSPFGI